MVIHRYSQEEHAFLRAFIPGHTSKEIAEEYNKIFTEPITVARVKSYMANHKLNNGLTGCFPKGHIPFNKGQKGLWFEGSEKTWFRKGHIPHNAKPIGFEKITKDGFVEVKVREHPENGKRCFERKHHIIWEAAHGPVPKGCVITFLDGDTLNCDISNLALITRAEHLQMTRLKLRSDNPKLTETGTIVAKLAVLTNAKRG